MTGKKDQFNPLRLRGGVYEVREGMATGTLRRPARRLTVGEHRITPDSAKRKKSPLLVFHVNPDFSITIDAGASQHGDGAIVLPTIQGMRADSSLIGAKSPLVESTLRVGKTMQDLAILESGRGDRHADQTRLVFVPLKKV